MVATSIAVTTCLAREESVSRDCRWVIDVRHSTTMCSNVELHTLTRKAGTGRLRGTIFRHFCPLSSKRWPHTTQTVTSTIKGFGTVSLVRASLVTDRARLVGVCVRLFSATAVGCLRRSQSSSVQHKAPPHRCHGVEYRMSISKL